MQVQHDHRYQKHETEHKLKAPNAYLWHGRRCSRIAICRWFSSRSCEPSGARDVAATFLLFLVLFLLFLSDTVEQWEHSRIGEKNRLVIRFTRGEQLPSCILEDVLRELHRFTRL